MISDFEKCCLDYLYVLTQSSDDFVEDIKKFKNSGKNDFATFYNLLKEKYFFPESDKMKGYVINYLYFGEIGFRKYGIHYGSSGNVRVNPNSIVIVLNEKVTRAEWEAIYIDELSSNLDSLNFIERAQSVYDLPETSRNVGPQYTIDRKLEVFRLFHCDKLSFKEIGDILSISYNLADKDYDRLIDDFGLVLLHTERTK